MPYGSLLQPPISRRELHQEYPKWPLTPHDIPWSVTDTWNNTEILGQSSGLYQWYVVRNVPGLHAPWSIIIQPLVPSRTSCTSQSEILTVSRNLSTNMLLLTVGNIGHPEVWVTSTSMDQKAYLQPLIQLGVEIHMQQVDITSNGLVRRNNDTSRH